MVLLLIILSTFFVSLGALIGVFTLAVSEEKLSKVLLHLVSLSAGVFIAGAFLHLLPEASEQIESGNIFLITLLSFVFFFFVEKLLHWRHCHKGHCEVHKSFGQINLIGDGIHNFIDGLIIAGAYLVDVKLGLVTTLAVALHEIPQEIGDFGVLLYSGLKKKKALFLNFLAASAVIFGGIAGYSFSFFAEGFIPYLLPLAAGGFIYIAASDLMPEIRKEERLGKSIVSFGFFILGIVLMFALKFLKAG